MRALQIFLIFSVGSAASASAQIPDEFTNLRVLPHDISRDSLITIMRNFSFALGVRCQHCHESTSNSFGDTDFPSDAKIEKQRARFMLRMVDNLNSFVMPMVPGRDTVFARVECKTCHRGTRQPHLLKNALRRALDAGGPDSAMVYYVAAREQVLDRGRYDFGEWETNTLAEELTREGRERDAIAIYQLNAEYYPESVSIQLSLGELFEEVGEVDSAIAAYERVLELRPGQQTATEKLEELR